MSLDGVDRPTVREAADDSRDRPTQQESSGLGVDRPTQREGATATARGTAGRRTYNLPTAILARYEYLGDLDGATGGSGAAFVLCRERATGIDVVVKWYRGGEALADERIMRVIEDADTRHVMPTRFEHIDGELWEVQEYFPLGTLETVRRAAAHPFSEEFVRSFLVEIADAVSYLHSIGVVHRDLKPANVFVRKADPFPLDLVVGDFNSSIQAQETVLASVRATWAYAPPEAGSTEVSPRADWWPIGIMTYELLIGRHPLADPATGLLPNENTIRDRVFQNDIDLSAVTDPRWALLIGGLLTWAEHDRWTATEVHVWLAGKSPRSWRTGPMKRTTTTGARGLAGIQPFVFDDVPYTEIATLTAAFVASWDAAVQQLAGRSTERLRDFLGSAGFDHDQAAKLINDFSPVLTLIQLQNAFIEGVPQFEGRSLSQESLTAIATAASRGDTAAGSWINDLRTHSVLRALSRYADDSGEVARASQRLDDWWDGIATALDRTDLDDAARTAVETQLRQTEGQLLIAAFDGTSAQALRSEALKVAARRDDVIAWANDVRSSARDIDVKSMADTGRAAFAIAVLPAARSLELGRLAGIREQEAAALRAVRTDLMRARRRRTGREFWLRLRIVFGYAVLAGFLSSLQFNGQNIVEWWVWPSFWGAFAAAGIGTLLLSLYVFLGETYVSPLRLGGRVQLFVGGVLISVMLIWDQVFPVSGYFTIAPNTWVIPPVTMLVAFVVAQVLNGVIGYRQTPAEERAGGRPWRERATQRYVRAFTGFTVFALIVLFIVVIGDVVESATNSLAQPLLEQSAPTWFLSVANKLTHWFPGGSWLSRGGSKLAATMAVAVGTLALTGLQRDIARRLPVATVLLLVGAIVLDAIVVLSSPWELMLALFFSVGAIIGAIVVGVIIAILFALA